ncbi:MAG: ferrous iron transporter B [Syntrophomonadaceae bacterium]|nr:ferrous iron transporter B [Syntrophomonadaceae bacterium]
MESDEEISLRIVKTIYNKAELIADQVIEEGDNYRNWDEKLDDILTSRWLGFPIMLLLLGIIFWITIIGANYPSEALAKLLFGGQQKLALFFMWLNFPNWLLNFLVYGVYHGLAWVIAVMLPPMAIFFPLFTLLEDAGYLPRVAFNLDNAFRKAGCHGKQALTMCMGFGCNAAGVVSARIIESPRERLIAILTNNFVPCNGRFPTIIILAGIFVGGAIYSYKTLIASAVVVGLVLIGIITTLLVSFILSKTLLKGVPSNFTLELPPYRKPLIGQVIIRSIMDRTLFVLARAVVVAAPAGGIIWLLANNYIGEITILSKFINWLDPFAQLLGMDGVILSAFILGLPANEIVLPIMIMGYLSSSTMLELDSLIALKSLLIDNYGWTWLTALSVMLFSLLHYPCATTLITINRETKSLKWAILAALIPLVIACMVCFSLNFAINFFSLL